MKIIKSFTLIVLLFLLPLHTIFAQNSKPKSTKKATSTKPKEPVKPLREIHWVSGAEPAFEDSANKYHKPAFLYIYIDNGDGCPAFNKTVLLDTNIINFVDSNFMAYKLNLEYDSPNAMKFLIDDVPAVILFDKRNTKEIGKLEGLHDAKEFRKFLMKAL
jgi:thioredoxin-related protein